MAHSEGSEKPNHGLLWNASNFPSLADVVAARERKLVEEATNTAIKLEVTPRTALEILSLRNSAQWSQSREDAMVEADRKGDFLPMVLAVNDLPVAETPRHV